MTTQPEFSQIQSGRHATTPIDRSHRVSGWSRTPLRPENGFTLIELLVTVILFSILASIAIPAYTQHVQTSRRADARLALWQISNELEKYYSDNLEYTDDLAKLGYANDNGKYLTPDRFYLLRLSTTSGSYTITARVNPDGKQAGDHRCREFILHSDGSRDASDTDCW